MYQSIADTHATRRKNHEKLGRNTQNHAHELIEKELRPTLTRQGYRLELDKDDYHTTYEIITINEKHVGTIDLMSANNWYCVFDKDKNDIDFIIGKTYHSSLDFVNCILDDICTL